MTTDTKRLFICRAPGCGLPFSNQAGRRNHESKYHADIYDSFKGQKGELLTFKSTAHRDKAKKKIRADLKKANGATPPAKKTPPEKPPEKETPAPETKPHTKVPPDPDPNSNGPEDITPPATAPPATPANPDNSHHNPNTKKKKGFWQEANDWWQGETQVDQ